MNNLLLQHSIGGLCTASFRLSPAQDLHHLHNVLLTDAKAMGIRMVTDPQVVDIATNAGYHSLFIDLEHSALDIRDANRLCLAGLCNGITPFVRVPYQCGDGFVQRILDGGAMGVVFPHIHTKGRKKPWYLLLSSFC